MKHLASKLATGTLTEEEHNRKLAAVKLSYHMQGFPLKIGFKDVEDAVATVLRTAIFQTEDPKGEIAVGTHVDSYPNRICCVWIYACSLRPVS